MAVKVSFGSFTESSKKAFVQSTNKARNSSTITWPSGTNTASVYVGQNKCGEQPLGVPGAYTRDAATDASFRTYRFTVSNTSDPTYGGATSKVYLRQYAREDASFTGSTTGTANENRSGYDLTSDTLIKDDETGCIWERVWTDTFGTGNVLTELMEYETPYTLSDVLDDLSSLWAAVSADFAGLSDSETLFFRWDIGYSVISGEDAWWSSYGPSFSAGQLAGFGFNGIVNGYGMMGSRFKAFSTGGIGVKFKFVTRIDDYALDPNSTPTTTYDDLQPVDDNDPQFYEPDLTALKKEILFSVLKADPDL